MAADGPNPMRKPRPTAKDVGQAHQGAGGEMAGVSLYGGGSAEWATARSAHSMAVATFAFLFLSLFLFCVHSP